LRARKIVIPTHCNQNVVDLSKNTPIFEHKYLPKVDSDSVKKLRLNFSEGTALRCLEQIIQSNDIMEACNRTKASQERGKTLRDELADARLCTAGVIVKSKHHRLELTVKDFVKESKEKQKEEAHVAGEKQRAYQIESRRKLEHVLVKNKPPLDWTISELNNILRVIKQKDNGPMPKKKPELWQFYQRLKHQSEDLLTYEAVFCGTTDVTNMDVIHEPVPHNNDQTDVPLSNEEQDAVFLLDNLFEAI